VRVPNPRLVRLGAVTRGAILEQGDGELIVTPVMQPVIELSSPIPRVFPAFIPGGIQEDSFYVNARQAQGGVDPGFPAGTQLASLARGAWVLECYYDMAQVIATTQAAQFCGLALVDPNANFAGILGRNWAGTAAGAHAISTGSRELHISFQVDSFLLSLFTPATVAGEALSIMVSVNARRIL
jgi:hypothetical protein